MLLNETFYLKRGMVPYGYNDRISSKDSIYIDTDTNNPNWESSIDYKDELKNTFGAKFSWSMKTWAWPIDGDIDELLNTKVKPALQFLNNHTRNGNRYEDNEIDGIINNLRQTVAEINSNIKDLIQVSQETDNEEAKIAANQLKQFKERLLKITSSEEFQELLGPVIEYGRNLDYQYSLGNLISMYLQDPEASRVMSEGDWKEFYNRNIITGAKVIWITTPAGDRIYNTASERDSKITEMMNSFGCDNWFQLTDEQQRLIKIELNKRRTDGEFRHRYKMTPHYDVRFTVPDSDTNTDTITNPVNNNLKTSPNPNNECLAYLKVIAKICEEARVTIPEDCLYKINNNEQATVVDLKKILFQLSKKLLYIKYSDNPAKFSEILNNKNLFQKQAAVCTWIVLKYLGYEFSLGFNMAWGGNENNDNNNNDNNNNDISLIFDAVANQAKNIYEMIKKLFMDEMFKQSNSGITKQRPKRSMNIKKALGESILYNLFEAKILNGQQLAECFGLGKQYNSNRCLTETTIKNDFYDILNKIQ